MVTRTRCVVAITWPGRPIGRRMGLTFEFPVATLFSHDGGDEVIGGSDERPVSIPDLAREISAEFMEVANGGGYGPQDVVKLGGISWVLV